MKDEKTRDFDVVAHWRGRAEEFRKVGNHGSAQFCDTHAHSLDAGLKRKEADRLKNARQHAEELISGLPKVLAGELTAILQKADKSAKASRDDRGAK